MQNFASTLNDADLTVGYYLYHTGNESNKNLPLAATTAIKTAQHAGLKSLFDKAFQNEQGIFEWARNKPTEREQALVDQVGRDGFNQIIQSPHLVDSFVPNKKETSGVTSASSDNEFFAYDSLLSLCKLAEPDTLEAVTPTVIERFNTTHSVVIHGSKTLIAEQITDHKGNACYTFSAVPQKRELYSNLNLPYSIVSGDKTIFKKVNAFNLWMRDLNRKTYQGVVFDPSGRTVGHFLNMWDGFAVTAVKGVDKLVSIMWHLQHIICDGNTEHFEYLLAWMADIVQKPEQKSGVCLVLKSEARGTGKSTVSVIMERLLGQHAIRVQDSKHIFGAFNSHLANKLFVTIEEAFWGGSNKDAGKLRTLITESTMTIEAKGKDAIEIASFHRYMMCTNNCWAVPQSADERRFFILEVSEQKKQDPAYFEALYTDINSSEVIGQFFNFLQNYDLSRFNLHKAPKTAATDQQIIESLPPEAKWLQALLDEGSLEDSDFFSEAVADKKASKAAFYNSYIRYCDMLNVQGYSRLSPIAFGSYLKKVAGITNGGKIQSGNRRVNAYSIPDLVVMKEQFCQHCNVPVNVIFESNL
ncbi:DUF5906 domain-containing protein [Photobacterium sagamiensis]|uniref:primase-helicase family protein n=1 Tax=Photobacterium sagamiensis TaxID=2910241 RepID=UPI003D0DF59F